MGNEYDNARDGALNGSFSCGSANRLEGSGESNLVALGVGWKERLFRLCFPSSGARFLFCFLLLNLVTVGFLS